MNNLVHTRYVACTKPFHDFLILLGYKMSLVKGNGLKTVYTFEKGKKIITSEYRGLTLKVLTGKNNVLRIEYTGLSIHDELLKSFTNHN